MTRHFRYVGQLARSVFAPQRNGRRRLRLAVTMPLVVLMVVAIAGALKPPAAVLRGAAEKDGIDVLMERTRAVDASFEQVEAFYSAEIQPLEHVLLHYRNDPRLVRRIATALVREGRRADVSPDLLLAVLLVENPGLDPAAQSPVGARGLMQVMPQHRGRWKACSESLESIDGNICYGAQIFRDYVRVTKGNYEAALLRYNGCVRGTNTPNCGQYPQHVFARVGRATFLSRAPRAGP